MGPTLMPPDALQLFGPSPGVRIRALGRRLNGGLMPKQKTLAGRAHPRTWTLAPSFFWSGKELPESVGELVDHGGAAGRIETWRQQGKNIGD